jgi:hypothetical protein
MAAAKGFDTIVSIFIKNGGAQINATNNVRNLFTLYIL